MRTVFYPLVALAWLMTPATAAAQSRTADGRQPPAVPLTLEAIERMALEANPTLAQAAAAVAAARGEARQAGQLPNPIVGYMAEEVSRGPVIRGGEHGFFIEQTIPLGGKLRLSREAFEQDAARAEAAVDVQRARVLGSVRMLFYQALVSARRLDVRERLAALSAEAVTVSGQLFNVGAADRPDVLEAEIESATARIDADAARGAHTAIWQRLSAMIGRPELTPQPLAGDVNDALPALDAGEALRRVLEGSPELDAGRSAVNAARARLARARREPVPDLFIRGGPMYNRELLDLGGTPVGLEASIQVGLSVPIFSRNQGGIAGAEAGVAAAERDLARLDLDLRARLAGAYEAYQTNRLRAERYRKEILPRAEEAHAIYLRRFREMAAAYPQVLIANRNLARATDQYLDAVDEAWRAATLLGAFLLEGGLDRPGGSEGDGPSAEPAARRD